MVISQLIRALLEENTVAVSGLGTFSIEHGSSHIIEDVVYPPQNIIVFEYFKDVESFDFVSKLSKWEQIRIDEAQVVLSEWINLIEKGLEHDKSVFFDNFGTFSKDLSGKIVFQSIIIPELNIENEGFDPVFIPSKIRKNNLPNKDFPMVDKRICLIKKEKKRDRLLFVFIITLSALLLCGLLLKNKFNDFYRMIFLKQETHEMIHNMDLEDTAYISSKLEEVATEIVSADNHIQATPVNDLTFHEEDLKDTDMNPSEPVTSDAKYLPFQKGKYYVIAGSFMKEEDALRHIKQKKLEKYPAKLVVQPENPRCRVCIGVFDNEIDAIEFAARLDKNYWILK